MKRFYGILLLVAVLLSGCKQEQEVKNLILLIGDGMGLAHVSLLEIDRQFEPTAFERADAVAFVATRSANNRVTDSAAAGTALATGEKVNNAALGVTPEGERLTTMMEMAHAQGKATGLVVTTYLQHATPAAFYAHTPDRGDYRAIQEQLVACGFDVLIGGGNEWFTEEHYATMQQRGYAVAHTIEAMDTHSEGRLLGVLSETDLPHAAERGEFLSHATEKALSLLAQHDEGFMLMVEGSLIDGMSHANNTEKILGEVSDFEHAVAVAMDFADTHPGTLVVVTADHETGGVVLASGQDDFTLPESGVRCRFGSHSHTAVRVPAYFYGAGADRFKPVMENTELAKQMMELLGLQ